MIVNGYSSVLLYQNYIKAVLTVVSEMGAIELVNIRMSLPQRGYVLKPRVAGL
jgi:hypothetical protein